MIFLPIDLQRGRRLYWFDDDEKVEKDSSVGKLFYMDYATDLSRYYFRLDKQV